MKKFKNTLVVALMSVGLVLGSCEDFLDLKPQGELLKDDALKTEEDVRMLLNSSYTALFSGNFLGGRTQIVSELLTENILGTALDGDWAVIYNRATSIFEGVVGGTYSEPYLVVYRVNNVLENLDLVQDQNLRNTIEGEAKFIRALAHFEVVRLFAQPYGFTPDNSHLGIPIKTQSKPQGATRATVKQVYDFIVQELIEAEQLLPTSINTEYDPWGAYPTKWAAKALLARVYFQMNSFSNAYQQANDVITSSPFTFNSSTEEFITRYSLFGTSEATFKSVAVSQKFVKDTVDGGGNPIQIITYSYSNRASGFTGNMKSDVSVPYMKLTQNAYLFGTSDPSDFRATAWYNQKDGFNVITKFNGNDNLCAPYITITELKLIRAEAAAETGSNITVAQQDIQDIFDRAYGVGARVAPSTANGIILEARNQRRLEFIFEGLRGQDLKRIGALGRETVTIRNAPWDCPGAILQFPQAEIANNPGFVGNPEGGC